MIILTMRTDKPESEIGLYDNQTQLAYVTWEAHRRLAETIHQKLTELLRAHGKELKDIDGIVVYRGPGSFTGLRIGVSVANALAYSLRLPIIGATDAWIESGIERLLAGQTEKSVLPEYGEAVRVTQQKK